MWDQYKQLWRMLGFTLVFSILGILLTSPIWFFIPKIKNYLFVGSWVLGFYYTNKTIAGVDVITGKVDGALPRTMEQYKKMQELYVEESELETMVGVKPKVTDIYPLSRFFSGFAFVYFAITMGGIATRHAMTPQEIIRLFIALFLTLLIYSALRAIDIQRNQNRD